jgi:hypothetical protein
LVIKNIHSIKVYIYMENPVNKNRMDQGGARKKNERFTRFRLLVRPGNSYIDHAQLVQWNSILSEKCQC